jgi:hypothetical protein
MNHEEKQYLALGKEVMRMIGDLRSATQTTDPAKENLGYVRRELTFRNGSVTMILCSDTRMADAFEHGMAGAFDVQDATPGSQVN